MIEFIINHPWTTATITGAVLFYAWIWYEAKTAPTIEDENDFTNIDDFVN